MDTGLQRIVYNYIEAFVLCLQCSFLETHYNINAGFICHKCVACGSKEIMDMEHKLRAYILAQHNKDKEKSEKDTKNDKGSKNKDT